jgi:hypothetical protein
MFLSRLEPDQIAGPNLLHWPAFALRPAASSRHNQRLAKRMSMPSRSRAGLKRNHGARDSCRISRLERLIDAYRSREPIGWTLCRWLRTVSSDFQCVSSFAITQI